jgi:hypothetical protein
MTKNHSKHFYVNPKAILFIITGVIKGRQRQANHETARENKF